MTWGKSGWDDSEEMATITVKHIIYFNHQNPEYCHEKCPYFMKPDPPWANYGRKEHQCSLFQVKLTFNNRDNYIRSHKCKSATGER